MGLFVFVGFACRQETSKQDVVDNPKSAQDQIEQIEKQETAIWQKAKETDNDLDGLTDTEEKQLGTNSKSIDTDEDGLMDYDEVKTFGTNPLKMDTDGDGAIDGEEVRMRTNPKGAGKL